jgi:hypothetical protein
MKKIYQSSFCVCCLRCIEDCSGSSYPIVIHRQACFPRHAVHTRSWFIHRQACFHRHHSCTCFLCSLSSNLKMFWNLSKWFKSLLRVALGFVIVTAFRFTEKETTAMHARKRTIVRKQTNNINDGLVSVITRVQVREASWWERERERAKSRWMLIVSYASL